MLTPQLIIRVLLLSLLTSSVFAQVSINSLTIAEDYYSQKVLEVEFDYDGSFGESISVGAQPNANREVFRDSYTLISIPKGVSTARVELARPATEDNDSVFSWGVTFRFSSATGRSVQTSTELFDVNWTGIKEYFGVEDAPLEILSSVGNIRVNEALENTRELIRWFAARSNGIDNIQISRYESSPPLPDLTPINSLVVAEDVTYDDLHRTLLKLQELQIDITSVRFIRVDDQLYTNGLIAVSNTGYIGGNPNFEDPLEELATLSSLEEIYARRNFTPTPAEQLSAFFLDQIIALNDESSARSSRRAQSLIESLLERDPNQPRAYVELARSLFRTEPCCEEEVSARNVTNIALNLFPDDPYVNYYAGYVEFLNGEPEKALLLYQIAEQQREEEIIWLINNWADTLLSLGRRDEALAKYSKLLLFDDLNKSDTRALFFGLQSYAEALKDDRDTAAGPIFARLLEEYPDRAHCVAAKYAEHILFAENDLKHATQVLGREYQYTCKDKDEIEALINIFAWYNGGEFGSPVALYNSFLKHPQVNDLIYRIANSNDPVPILQALKSNGVNLDQVSAGSGSALQRAISNDNSYAIRSLANGGSNINDDMGDGFTPLMFALFMENVDAVRVLVEEGADPELVSEFGMSALDLAEQSGDEEMLEALQPESTTDV